MACGRTEGGLGGTVIEEGRARRISLGAGLTIEVVRNQWTFWIFTALRQGQMTPKQLLPVVNAAAGGHRDMFGERRLGEKIMFEVLRRHKAEQLLDHRYDYSSIPRGSLYWLTDFAVGLSDQLDLLAAPGARHHSHLVAITAERHGTAIAPVGTVDAEDPWTDPAIQRATDVAMILETLHPRWSFAILAALRAGPTAPTRALSLVNEGLDRNRLVVGARTLSPKMCWQTLDRLEADGLIARDRVPGVPPKADCSLTPFAADVLDTLDTIGVWALDYLEQIIAIVRARRRLTSSKPASPARRSPAKTGPEAHLS